MNETGAPRGLGRQASPVAAATPATAPTIGEVIFEGGPARPGRASLSVGLAGAIALHVLLWGWARTRQPSLESWSATLAARVHAELTREEVIEVAKPVEPPPPPPPPTPSAPHPPPATAPRMRATAASPARAPAPPAQAARVVTAESPPNAPVDLTGDAVATGTARVFAGGATSASGKNATAAAVSAQPSGASAARAPTVGDRSSVVHLEADEWECAWPREADAEDTDQQSVVLRVVVRADGTAEAARLISDPGRGFGATALACALRTRFVPARDGNGQPRRAESPPIRVRFTR